MSDDNSWVSQLLHRHAAVLGKQSTPSAQSLTALNTLQLADALLDKCRLCESHPDHALQVALVGPTQSGKSTLVNVLLDTNAAGISALAGFTVHAQGYANGYSEQALQLLSPMLKPLHRVSADALATASLDSYVLESVTAGPAALINPAVVWDTPDFDSIDATSYTHAVMRSVAIADVVILVVSKDKYGDKRVWDMLQLIEPLHQPLLVCINKLDPQDETTVLRAFTIRYQERLDTSLPPIIPLPFVRRNTTAWSVALPDAQLSALQAALHTLRNQVDRQATVRFAQAFIEQHREQWLAPLIEERSAATSWRELIDSAIVRARVQYERDYLDDPGKYDTFNRALAELLTLLEIPGIAPALGRARHLVTWPARKLLGLGRDAYDRQVDPVGYRARQVVPISQEAQVLERILDTTLVSLQGALLEQPPHPFWQALAQAFRHREPLIRQRYLAQSEAVRKQFEPEVEAAAHRLFEQLQAQPTLLNTLRAARATADAAGVALALKSGGLAPADLVLAPAMLSVTTLLTESALGKYLDTIKHELKERQRQHIHTHLLQGVLVQELDALTSTLTHENLFAQQLEPELRKVLEQAVN
ncbi:MAG: GTPase domain-containing protein [Granulosicoccus sp.]|nr:GTPase domain-containing protein [Granulosicoccus sp.]